MNSINSMNSNDQLQSADDVELKELNRLIPHLCEDDQELVSNLSVKRALKLADRLASLKRMEDELLEKMMKKEIDRFREWINEMFPVIGCKFDMIVNEFCSQTVLFSGEDPLFLMLLHAMIRSIYRNIPTVFIVRNGDKIKRSADVLRQTIILIQSLIQTHQIPPQTVLFSDIKKERLNGLIDSFERGKTNFICIDDSHNVVKVSGIISSLKEKNSDFEFDVAFDEGIDDSKNIELMNATRILKVTDLLIISN